MFIKIKANKVVGVSMWLHVMVTSAIITTFIDHVTMVKTKSRHLQNHKTLSGYTLQTIKHGFLQLHL